MANNYTSIDQFSDRTTIPRGSIRVYCTTEEGMTIVAGSPAVNVHGSQGVYYAPPLREAFWVADEGQPMWLVFGVSHRRGA